MRPSGNTLSVHEVASSLGVSRGTVGYWLRTGKLKAYRTGRNYLVPIEDLLIFIKARGLQVPAKLAGQDLGPHFHSALDCWEFWQESGAGLECGDCIVRAKRIGDCFTARRCKPVKCRRICSECRYYEEQYLPRIQFMHQIALPAAVWKDLYFWGGNDEFARLCGIGVKDLIGLGLEDLIHPDSLKIGISCAKRIILGDPKAPRIFASWLKTSSGTRIKATITLAPLKEPAAATLMIADPTRYLLQ